MPVCKLLPSRRIASRPVTALERRLFAHMTCAAAKRNDIPAYLVRLVKGSGLTYQGRAT